MSEANCNYSKGTDVAQGKVSEGSQPFEFGDRAGAWNGSAVWGQIYHQVSPWDGRNVVVEVNQSGRRQNLFQKLAGLFGYELGTWVVSLRKQRFEIVPGTGVKRKVWGGEIAVNHEPEEVYRGY